MLARRAECFKYTHTMYIVPNNGGRLRDECGCKHMFKYISDHMRPKKSETNIMLEYIIQDVGSEQSIFRII